jgi:hypothetical protein
MVAESLPLEPVGLGADLPFFSAAGAEPPRAAPACAIALFAGSGIAFGLLPFGVPFFRMLFRVMACPVGFCVTLAQQ